MRRFTVAIILFIFVVALSITEKIYLDSLSEKLYNSITETEYNYNISQISASGNADEAIKLWESNKIWLSIFVNHEKLDEISEAFVELKVNCEGSKQEFELALNNITFLIDDLIKEESLSIYSFL